LWKSCILSEPRSSLTQNVIERFAAVVRGKKLLADRIGRGRLSRAISPAPNGWHGMGYRHLLRHGWPRLTHARRE
jgi:hypothetical protein